MPHAIRIRLQTDIAEGLLSSEIGTTADESNRIAVNGKYSLPGSNFIAMSPMKSFGNAPVAVFHPYPVKPLLLQGSLLPIRPLMPQRILNKHAATSVVGLISYDVGTALDMSSAGMITPSPPPEDIIQGSACLFGRNNLSVPKLITVPTLPLMPLCASS